jgi:hypothetical protein
MPAIVPPETYTPILRGARQQIVTQHAITALTFHKQEQLNLAFIPTVLLPSMVKDTPSHIKHFALPVVHPVISETISSYKNLMHNPATSEIW